MSGTATLESRQDSGRGTTDWMFERWDAEQAAWAAARMRRLLPDRIIAARPEPVQRDFRALKVAPYSVTEHHGNVITNAGWQALLKAATSGASGPLVFSSTVGRLGVGDGTTTPLAADTDLGAAAGSAHRLFKFMGAAPTVGSGTNRTWTFVATFGSADFNQSWQEFGIDSGTADGTTVTAPLLNHALSNQGTKTSGQVWTATAVLSFTLCVVAHQSIPKASGWSIWSRTRWRSSTCTRLTSLRASGRVRLPGAGESPSRCSDLA